MNQESPSPSALRDAVELGAEPVIAMVQAAARHAHIPLDSAFEDADPELEESSRMRSAPQKAILTGHEREI